MKRKMQVLLSIAAVGLFGFLAMASFGSTNTSVQAEKCSAKPPFSGVLTIEVVYKHRDGTRIANAPGTLFLTHQVIEDTIGCHHGVVSEQQIPFVTDMLGTFTYVTPNFIHDNQADLWRAEVLVPKVVERYRGFRTVQVAKYNMINLHLQGIELEEL